METFKKMATNSSKLMSLTYHGVQRKNVQNSSAEMMQSVIGDVQYT
ncbi:hypothetical protein T01_6824 [Trichinella spiralis]|uniref:Uncharacterized protein n=1 Tax=Trichinella spiralis TaxID=6334 RepID=A0A0V1AIA4_TRISP|nr:hypothetical protein T01_6824 [Trichinella spiralis]